MTDSNSTNLGHDVELVYNEAEAARVLCISKRTLQKLRKTNRIAAVRINSRVVYERKELHDVLKRNRTSWSMPSEPRRQSHLAAAVTSPPIFSPA